MRAVSTPEGLREPWVPHPGDLGAGPLRAGRGEGQSARGSFSDGEGAGRRTPAGEGLTGSHWATAPCLPRVTSLGCRACSRPLSTCCGRSASALGEELTGPQRRAGLFKGLPAARPPELGSAPRCSGRTAKPAASHSEGRSCALRAPAGNPRVKRP